MSTINITSTGATVIDINATVTVTNTGTAESVWGGITGTLSDQTDLQTALDNKIDLNGNNSAITYENFTPSAPPAYQEGRVWYDSTSKTLSVYDNFSGTSIQLGKELIVDARNNSGATILNGQVVYINGALGQYPTIALARANSIGTSEIIGVATHDIANNTNGKVTIIGEVNSIDTSSFTDGQQVYLSSSTAGLLTATPPVSPNFVVFVGYISHAHPTQGKLLVMSEKALANSNSLGTSQVASPTQNAVKQYVDNGTATLANKTLTDPVINAGGVTARVLVSMVQTSLASNYNATAGAGEEEVTGLRVTLPVLASGTYLIKITFKGYVATVAGNNNIRTRFGTSTSYLTNTLLDNLYVANAKIIESLVGTVIVTANLSTQHYVVIGFINDVNRLNASFSSSGARTNVLVEIYR